MNTEKAKVSPLYLQLIEGMHQDKLKINDAKLARHTQNCAPASTASSA